MSLIKAMVFLERVIKVSVRPVEVWNYSEVPWHLSMAVWLILVLCSQRIQLFVEIRVNDTVSKVVMGLLPEILWMV